MLSSVVLPLLGLELADQNVEQRRFAAAVGTDDADLVAAVNRRAEVLEQAGHRGLGCPVAEAHLLRLDDLGGGTSPLLHVESYLADPFPAVGTIPPKLLQGTHATFVSGATSLDALTNPRLLLRQLLVEQRPFFVFIGEQVVFSTEEGGVAALPRGEAAPIEFDDTGGETLEKRSIVGDEEDAAMETEEDRLELVDMVQIQMVGWLVQEKHVGITHEGLAQ